MAASTDLKQLANLTICTVCSCGSENVQHSPCFPCILQASVCYRLPMVAHGKEPGIDTASGPIAAAFASGMAFLEVSSDANRAIARTMKRAATRAGSEATATNEVEVPHRLDGRECECCKKKDSSPCLVFPQKFRKWFYPPAAGKTQGKVCWFCGRVWSNRK